MNVIEKTHAAAVDAYEWAKSKTSTVVAIGTAGAAAVATSPAFAAGEAVDVTDVVTKIGAQLVPIGLIGVAVLGVVVAVKAFQWVRRALS
jgi:hypothetical protein